MANELGQPNLSLLVAGVAAGIGLVAAGLLNLFLSRGGAWVRAAVGLTAVGAAAGGAALLAETGWAVWAAAGVVGGGLVVAGGGAWATRVLAAAARRPAARWAGLAAAGVAVAAGAALWHDRVFEESIDRTMREMEFLSELPDTRAVTGYRVTTDHGSVVAVAETTDPDDAAAQAAREASFLARDGVRNRLIRCQPPDDRTNCHGWVFTGGRYWVGGAEVERILAENGYATVTDPRPGDLAVYRQNGMVAHTAVVRYVSPGMPVLVEGKWGASGVYLHAVRDSIYGIDFTYYRTARQSHVLAGLDRPAPVVAGGQ